MLAVLFCLIIQFFASCPWYRITSVSDGTVRIYRLEEKINGKWVNITSKHSISAGNNPRPKDHYTSNFMAINGILQGLCDSRVADEYDQRRERLYERMKDHKWEQVKRKQ